jgi:hypothetical protein
MLAVADETNASVGESGDIDAGTLAVVWWTRSWPAS